MADDMTLCDPPCDECGCCCGAMLPMIVTLEPVGIAYKLPEVDSLAEVMNRMTLSPHLVGEVKPGHP